MRPSIEPVLAENNNNEQDLHPENCERHTHRGISKLQTNEYGLASSIFFIKWGFHSGENLVIGLGQRHNNY